MKRQWSRGRKLSLLGDSSTLGATDEMRGFLLRRFQEFLEAKLVLSIWWAISWRSKYGYEGLVAACSLGWLGSTCRGKASFRLSRAGPFYSEELFVLCRKKNSYPWVRHVPQHVLRSSPKLWCKLQTLPPNRSADVIVVVVGREIIANGHRTLPP